MGGLAVIVNWGRPVRSDELDPMLDLVPHRTTGGIGSIAFDRAALAETHFDRGASKQPSVAAVGSLAIVGDLRLWNREKLRARVGGSRQTEGMSDRRLVLEAYRRTGLGFLDDIDGDFAFVIWDDTEQRAMAVRDRFGAKPLFLERTPTGIRFASEPKQLAATSNRVLKPNDRSIAEHLTRRYAESRFTFFDGIERVPPSTALVCDPRGEHETRYWDPHPDTVPPYLGSDAAEGLRERLVDAVRRRLSGIDTAVAQLSGGHDSTSVTAAAHALADRGLLTTNLHTASAVFPGYPNDESRWITEIAARQPFPHHDFVPNPETTARFEADMWESDTPRPAPIDGIWAYTIRIAQQCGADLVLTGDGGDEVLDEFRLLADLLRSGRLIRWARGVQDTASWTRRPITGVGLSSIRDTLPSKLKQSIRLALPRSQSASESLMSPDLQQRLTTKPPRSAPFDGPFPSLTQNLVISYVRSGRLVQILEYEEQRYARGGLDVSHPFLDRAVVEYVAAVPLARRPNDGRTKTLARRAFSDWLPQSVLDRRTATYADGYLDVMIGRLQPHYIERYPRVPPIAKSYIDSDRYADSVRAALTDPPEWHGGQLWSAWTLMAWLDRLDQYDRSKWL